MGKDVERKVGIVEWRRVMGRRDGGMLREGRMRRFGISARGVEVIGVMIRLLHVSLLTPKSMKRRFPYRVRTMSNGAKINAATPAEATATTRLAIGLGLSSTFNFPKFDGTAAGEINVGSGRLRIADRKLRVQVSIVLSNTLYTNVEFVPFHTPHALSFCHS